MPHIIVEYSKNLGEIIEISDLVSELHNVLSDQGIEKDRIKTRAISCNYVAVGDCCYNDHMLHATLLLLEGRDVETRQKYGSAIYNTLNDSVKNILKNCSVTLEVREMNKDTYYM